MNKGIRLAALLMALLLTATGCSMIKINKAVDDQTVLAEFTGGKVLKAEAQAEYDEVEAYYAAYGYTLDEEEAITSIKGEILDYLAQEQIVAAKAKELGLYDLSEEEKNELTAAAEQEYEDTVAYYLAYFETGEEGETEESVRKEVEDFLTEQGYSKALAVEYSLEQAWQDKLNQHVTEGVTATDAQIQVAYDELVAADQESYSSDPYSFEYAAMSGSAIYWYPEGYRTVKHILLEFPTEQVEKLSETTASLEDVRYQIEELDWQEEAEADAADGADEAVDEHAGHDHGETELAGEQEPDTVPDEPAKSREELEAEEKTLEAQVESLKAEYAAALQDKVAEVQKKMADGADFDDLIAQYGADAGMREEPTKTTGYYVSANSEMWEAPFTAAAMALSNPGDVSDPVVGSNGIHIIRYISDVTPGAVDIEEVRETCAQNALDAAKTAFYDETVAGWVADAKVKTYPDRWK